MLEKNKNCIEFSMRSMMVTHKPYQEDTEIAITGMIPGREILAAGNLFDIPCDVVMVPKREFEKLQTENEELKKKLKEFSPVPGYREFLTALYPGDDVEKLVQITERIFSQDRWKFWKDNYEALSKLVGFSSVEEIQDYLTNEAECDTLHEAISKLKDQVKCTCDEWYSANSRNNSWKAAAECNTPKELIEKLNLLRDDISGRRTVIEHYKRDIEKWQKATGYLRPEDISTASLVTKAMQLDQEVKILNGALQEWKEGTGCPDPIAAKALIESGMAYEHGFHEAQEENQKLTEEIDSWKNVTGYSTPEDYLRSKINAVITGSIEWQKATGCDTPEAAKKRISGLISEAEAWESDYNHLLALTGFDNEGEIEDFLEQNNDRNKLTTVIDNLKLENETMKTALRTSNRAMQKELENNIDEWQKFTGCDFPQESGCKINRLCDDICKLKGDYDHLLKLTGYKSEHDIRILLHGDPHEYRSMRDLINSLKNRYKFSEANWQKATGCDTPGRAEEKFEFYKERLGKAVQAASCAAKHLENIMS